jgi:hypothetical protein
MFGMLERLSQPRAESLSSSTETPSIKPTEPARASFFERILAALEPEPSPPPEPAPQSPTVRVEGSNAQLIPDSEYAPGLRSIATENWRASIEENVVKFDERRGTRPTSKYIG